MALRLVQANLKARDDATLGRFWAQALGWTSGSVPGATSVAPEGFVWTAPDAPVCIDIIAVPDPATVRHRAHLELATTSAAHHTDLVTRLTNLGATPAGTRAPWTVLTDPEGNAFCVREPRDGYQDTGPIAAVVVDCTDPRTLARFWSEAMDWTLHDLTDEHALLRSAPDTGPYVELLRTPHLPADRHRAHLDVVPHGDGTQAAEVARLQTLGASPADVGQGGTVSWTVLTDPEGNEFCVLAPS